MGEEREKFRIKKVEREVGPPEIASSKQDRKCRKAVEENTGKDNCRRA